MTALCGKGIWIAHAYDLQRAIEMATSVEATHLILKVGHGPHYFPETARRLGPRIRNLGFHPLAWVEITDRLPQEAHVAITQALALGYEAVILYLGRTLITRDQIQPLTKALTALELPREQLLVASPPLAQLPDRRVMELLAPLCKGGWLPLCFAEWGNAADVIDREVYQSLSDLSLLWEMSPPVYPVLSPLQKLGTSQALLPEEFVPWMEGVMRHGVDFFSIYHAASTEKALWPLLQATTVACQQETAEPPREASSYIPQPVYITLNPGDTLWSIINKYGLTKQKFWEWNGHLWDSRGLPRDSDYMQEGWRIRVK